MMSNRLSGLSWEAFRDLVPSRCDLVLLPVGTIEAHGGSMRAQNRPDGGARVGFTLPVRERGATA